MTTRSDLACLFAVYSKLHEANEETAGGSDGGDEGGDRQRDNIYFVERLKRKTFPSEQQSSFADKLSSRASTTADCSFLRFSSK